ncbi:MAG: GtrA family protein [Clostridiales bacterium]|jgi:putative flippase GtrA|nr:GtrA family protein [Clostridiales bacterium]
MKMLKKLIEKFLTREIITYLVFGVLTTLVGLSTYWLFSEALGIETVVSNILSSLIAIVFAYITNKIFVFRSPSWEAKLIVREFVPFISGRLLTMLLETVLLKLLVDYAGLPNMWVKFFLMVIVVVLNYIVSKFAVFVKR